MLSKLRAAIESRKLLVGTLVSINSCELAEALSGAGLDWLFFDLEHSTVGLSDVQRMIQAVRPPCLTLVRIEQPEPVYIKKALDTGCYGIIVPQVNTPEIAQLVVDAGKYAPLGNRSVGLSRSVSYGRALASAVKMDNDEKSIIVQIEHAMAVENLEKIINVPGVDGVFVGPYDLSSSMGLIGEVKHERVQAAIDRIAISVRKKGLPLGIFVGSDDALGVERKRGFQFIAVGSDLLRLVSSCQGTAASRDKSGGA
jgi:2-keto-3-deoxy-L-rhamnonate aldolase RhmA